MSWVKGVFLYILTVFFASSVAVFPAQRETPQRFVISSIFTTPQAAVDYANTFSKETGSIQFSFEFSGNSVPTVYRVAVDQNSAIPAAHWEQWTGFTDVKDVVNFANKMRAVAQFVSCWNPFKNPVSTSIVVFFVPSTLPETSRYKIVDKTFTFPSEVTEFLNNNSGVAADMHSVQFLSEMMVANQLASVWRIVYLADSSRKSSKGNQLKWHAQYYSTLDDALAEISANPKVADYRIASSFTTWDVRSKFVLFILQAP